MRGLSHFIRDIRATSGDKRKEKDRVEEELAKIKAKIVDEGQMSLYNQKKYVCKLMFISMLGYPITFGHLEGIKLMAERTAPEKLIGYLSTTVLLNENSPLMKLATHTIYRDVLSGTDLHANLALTAVANIGSMEFVEAIYNVVQKIVLNEQCNTETLKRSVLTLLCVYRKNPDIIDFRLTVEKLLNYLESSSEGLIMACVSFMISFAKKKQSMLNGVQEKLFRVLSRLINERDTDPGNFYYGVPAPWLQCKILALLKLLNPPSEPRELEAICSVLRKIIRETEKVMAEARTQYKQRGTTNRVNAIISVFSEVVNLIIHWNLDVSLATESVAIIESLVTNKRSSNIRYIGLSLLSRLSNLKIQSFDYSKLCKTHEQDILVALHDRDVSLRLQALSVVVSMCSARSAVSTLKELLSYLSITSDSTFRERLLRSIFHIAEQYLEKGGHQYTDVMMATLTDGADNVFPPEVIQATIDAVVKNVQVQKRAVTNAFHALKGNAVKNEVLVSVSALFLGAYGCQIALNPESTPLRQISLLRKQLPFVSEMTQGSILHAFMRMYTMYEHIEVRERIKKMFRQFTVSSSLLLQQWSREYLQLIENFNPSNLSKLLEFIPPLNRLAEAEGKLVEEPLVSSMKVNDQEGALSFLSVLEEKTRYIVKGLSDEGEPSLDVFDVWPPDNVSIAESDNALLLSNLLRRHGDLLFQDDQIEINCYTIYSLADARLTLTVRSRNEHSNLHDKPEISIAGTDAGLLLEMREVENPSVLAAVEFAARSAYPFLSLPCIRLKYAVSSKAFVKILQLPIPSFHFVTPYKIASGNFEETRSLFEAKKRSLTSIMNSKFQLTRNSVEALLKKLGYTVTSPSGEGFMNIVQGIGAHSTSSSSVLQATLVLCQVQIINEWKTSVTVYSPNSILREAVIASVRLHLCP